MAELPDRRTPPTRRDGHRRHASRLSSADLNRCAQVPRYKLDRKSLGIFRRAKRSYNAEQLLAGLGATRHALVSHSHDDKLLVLPVDFLRSFFFSRFLSESSETFRMLPYDCINRRCSLAVIMQEIF